MGAVSHFRVVCSVSPNVNLKCSNSAKHCWHCGDLVYFFFFFNFSSSHLVLGKWFSFSVSVFQLYSIQICVFLAT